MNVRRVLILSITLLLAGAAGYGLLGLKAPKRAPAATPDVTASTQTIIAVGPDGNLYAIRAPAGTGGGRASSGGAYGGYEREEGGRSEHGYEHE
ncbi:MAG TPA: hypothetical protein VKA00_04235 [Trueperaceae bacterium]|nr:hypothetical protein [Trueperaceae bacterium]